jgi:hypothetical protein
VKHNPVSGGSVVVVVLVVVLVVVVDVEVVLVVVVVVVVGTTGSKNGKASFNIGPNNCILHSPFFKL